jgi:hypothetical protein
MQEPQKLSDLLPYRVANTATMPMSMLRRPFPWRWNTVHLPVDRLTRLSAAELLKRGMLCLEIPSVHAGEGAIAVLVV